MRFLIDLRLIAICVFVSCLTTGPQILAQDVTSQNADKFSKQAHTFKTVDGLKIQADVYRHQDDLSRPVVVWLHGGALIMGSRDGVPQQLKDLAKEHHFIVVSLGYRLAPEAKLSEIIEDVTDGLNWVRRSGRELFHADTSRMVVAGASAGGYLALMSGIVSDPPPLAIVSYWGFGDVDGDWTTKPSDAYRKGKLIEKAFSRSMEYIREHLSN